MTATAKIAKKLSKSELLGRLDASIYNGVMRWAQHPEHVALVISHDAMGPFSLKFWLVGEIDNPAFATVWNFANLRKIRIFFVEAGRHVIRSVFCPTREIVLPHGIGIHALELPRLFLNCLQNALIRTVFSDRTAIFTAHEFFSANTTIDRRVFPIRHDAFATVLAGGSALQRAVDLSIILALKRGLALRTFFVRHAYILSNLRGLSDCV